MDEFEKEVYGELFGESGDDDFDIEKELEGTNIEEDGDDAVAAMLDGALGGDISDDLDGDGDDDDLAELEKEFHASQAGEVDEEGDDDPDFEEGSACAANDTRNASAGANECGTACGEGVDDEVPPLDPEVDLKGDKMLAAVMTPDLLASELDASEYDEFVESGDISIAASEGFLTDDYVMEAFEDTTDGDLFEEAARFAPEGRKYKMTKSARLRQLYEVSLQIEARLHKDPQYKMMQKVYKARRKIRNNWRKRYGALAMRRAKKYLKALIRSNSSGLNKIASRLTGK